jgi:hypothetical protein
MMEPYNLLNDTDKFNNRPLFVYDPAWDTLTGNQSQLFFYNISNRSADAEIVTLDPYRGAALHCGVGGTANLNNRIAQFLYKVFGTPSWRRSSRRASAATTRVSAGIKDASTAHKNAPY